MSQPSFYSQGGSYLHRCHAAVKLLLFAVVISVLPFGLTHWQAYLALLVGLTVLLVSSGVKLQHLLAFSPALGFIGLAFLSWLFTDLGGSPILEIHLSRFAFVLREHTFLQALISSLRAFVWVLSYMLLLTTTSSRDLVAGLEWLRLPYQVCCAVGMALRFWHTTIADTMQVMDAQRVRGLDYEQGPIFTRFKLRFLVATIPTLFLLLKRFRTLSFALALRSFGMPGKRTRLYAPHLTWYDGLFSFLVLVFLVLLLLLDH